MRRAVFFCLLASLIITASCSPGGATTWAPAKVTCPICGTANAFQEVRSYGSYIYSWPSKYQFIFWPLTDTAVLWSCQKCHLTCYKWDFRSIPKAKIAAIKERLQNVKLTPVTDYRRRPMPERLKVADMVYSSLGRDDEFWCEFYRVMGYHLEEEHDRAGASEARRKALSIAERMLRSEKYAETHKELLLISGAMRHFLGDDRKALADFRAALKLSYRPRKMPKEEAKGKDGYLSELLAEYIKGIQNPKTGKGFGRGG